MGTHEGTLTVKSTCGVSFILKCLSMLQKVKLYICTSPNVGRYYGLVTGPPQPPPAMEAMEAAAATERFRRLFVCLFVCEQYSGKTPRWISTKLGGGVRYGPLFGGQLKRNVL